MPRGRLPAWRGGAGASIGEAFHKALIRLTEGCVTTALAPVAGHWRENHHPRNILPLPVPRASSAPFIDTGRRGAIWQRKVIYRDIMNQSKRCWVQCCAFCFCTHPRRAFGLPHTSDTGLRLRLWRSAVLCTSEVLLASPK